MKIYDCIIIGAGAAGLKAAAQIQNKNCLILDMGNTPARKINVSGGGRCNFTNDAAKSDRYFGQNPNFAKSALAQVKSIDILNWVKSHGLGWVEKSAGQYFCSTNAGDITAALLSDCKNTTIKTDIFVTDITKQDDVFTIHTDKGLFYSKTAIIATGGISYPSLTVSDIGYKIAKSFGHKIIPPTPGLVGLKTDLFSPELSGISMPVEIKINKTVIADSLLFTHFGIGGPVTYRISNHKVEENDLFINFLPDTNVYDWLISAKGSNGKKSLQNILSQKLPQNFVKLLLSENTVNIADYKNSEIREISNDINNFCMPRGSLKRRGINSAEVTLGGVSTDEISSKTYESKLCPNLYFAGEVIDIAGDLGGFNLHFAFASGTVAGISVKSYLDLS